jgi:F-type H+-transporting ATPase subunit b
VNITATIIGQVVWFGLFVWFVMKIVWPALDRMIETRQKTIADGLAAAEKGKQALELSSKQAESELAAARERVGELIASAETRDSQMLEEAKAAARAEADRIVAAAQADIEQQIARAKEMLREQVSALAVAGAEKILRREVDMKAHAELLVQLKREI